MPCSPKGLAGDDDDVPFDAGVDERGGTGVQQSIDTAVYDLLDHVTVYPVQNESKWTDGQGEVLPDAFLLPRGSTPKDLAYAVHYRHRRRLPPRR